MAIYRNIDQLDIGRSVVTIGSFDGVHCGHQMLLRRVVDLAKQNGGRSVAVTFWPHPRQVLDPEGTAPLLLNTLDEKIALLLRSGVDDVVVFPFDQSLSRMSASEFMKDIVIGKLNARYLVAGQDHRFGKDRGGDAAKLQAYVADNSIRVEIVDLKKLDHKISSSFIRKAIADGDLRLAGNMLGYDYVVSGKIIPGNRLGRTIGFPTANIETPSYKLLPMEGVYRVKVALDGICSGSFTHLGMMYIGARPVLKDKDAPKRVEVNIFDFAEEIYDREITVALTHRIRGDMDFDNFGELSEQLGRDKENVLHLS